MMNRDKYANRVANYGIIIGVLVLIGSIIEFEGLPALALAIFLVVFGYLTKVKTKKGQPINNYFIPLTVVWFIFAFITIVSLFLDFIVFIIFLALGLLPIYNTIKYFRFKDENFDTEVPL
jgi:predicted membrane protein